MSAELCGCLHADGLNPTTAAWEAAGAHKKAGGHRAKVEGMLACWWTHPSHCPKCEAACAHAWPGALPILAYVCRARIQCLQQPNVGENLRGMDSVAVASMQSQLDGAQLGSARAHL